MSRGSSSVLTLASACVTLFPGCVVFEAPQPGYDAGSNASMDAGTDAGEPVDAGYDASPDAAESVDAAGEEDAGTSCVVPSITTFDDCTGPVVINEVDGSGEDYIEIYNRGPTDVNISGWLITDESSGGPDVAEGTPIPVGTVLGAGRFLYLWANLTGPQPGIRTADCLPSAPPPCLHSAWGISAGGERVYLLDDGLEIVCAFQYPGAVFGGESFGRVADGTETLCPLDPTPGEANVSSPLR